MLPRSITCGEIIFSTVVKYTFCNSEISKDEQGTVVDQSLYKSMIHSLLYLIDSHTDITFSIYVYALYQAKPKINHFTKVKIFIKYIIGTSGYAILYSFHTSSFLVVYYDVD